MPIYINCLITTVYDNCMNVYAYCHMNFYAKIGAICFLSSKKAGDSIPN